MLHSLATTTLAGRTLARVAVGVTAYTIATVAIAEGVGRLLDFSEPLSSAFVLVSAFPNAGNYGVPLSEFAFGAAGRATLDAVGGPAVLEMAIAPVVGGAVAGLLASDDPTVGRVFVLECGKPAAVTPMILVLEFGGGDVRGVSVGEYVGTVVFVTTLVPVVTATVLISLLRAGVL